MSMQIDLIRHCRRLVQRRELVWVMARSELLARHRQTLLGVAWAVLQPVAMLAVFGVVFSVFARVRIDYAPYAVFAFVGLVSWLFFAHAVSQATTSVVANMNLVTKSNFPREIIPISKIVIVGVDFLIGCAVLAVLLWIFGVAPSVAWFAVPQILLIQVTLITGVAFFASALYVFWRDLGRVLPTVLHLGMFLSPVVYPVTLIPAAYRDLYMWNPMARLLEGYRAALLQGQWPPWELILPPALVAGALLIGGYAYFKANEMRFADVK